MALAALLVWLTVTTGVTGVTRVRNAEVALKWRGNESTALAQSADRLLKPDATPAALAKAKQLALDSIERSPLEALAVRTLGLIASIEGDARKAERLMRYSNALSRRDLATQLWLINASVARNDVRSALGHFDVALRTSPASKDILLPILVNATEDANLLPEIVRLTAASPPWRGEFLYAAVDKGPDAGNVGKILAALSNSPRPPEPLLNRVMIGRLITESRWDDAWRTYRTVKGRAFEEGLVRNGSFQAADDMPPFDWLYGQPDQIPADRASLDGGEMGLSFRTSGETGDIARQLLLLPPGRYRLSGRGGVTGADSTTLPLWSVSCAEKTDASEYARGPLPATQGELRPFGGEFIIPAGCRAQWLLFRARAGGATEALLTNVSISRV